MHDSLRRSLVYNAVCGVRKAKTEHKPNTHKFSAIQSDHYCDRSNALVHSIWMAFLFVGCFGIWTKAFYVIHIRFLWMQQILAKAQLKFSPQPTHTHIKITHKPATTTTTHKKWIACVRLISCSFVKRLQSLLCVSVTALYSLACQRFCHVFVCMHIMYVAAMRIEFCDTESVPIPSACIDSLNAVRCSFDQTNACLCLSYICV